MKLLGSNKLVLHLFIGILLTLIYPIQELFSANQNIYFLWGMNEIIPNNFTSDPLLNSPDPYPVFSWLISMFPVKLLPYWTTILYLILQSVYSFALFGIADRFGKIYSSQKRLFSFCAMFLFIHASAIWGPYLNIQTGMDLRWVWDSGIAEQGVLRGYLQPSAFGVFFLMSFYRAQNRDFHGAIIWIAPAATLHAGYLFLGALLTLIYLLFARFERSALISSGVLFTISLPYVIYTANHFLFVPDDVRTAIAVAVESGFESNIHLNPKNWLVPKFYLQLGLMIVTLITVERGLLRRLLLSVLMVAGLLTIIGYILSSTTIISLNPWRFSVILVPICSVLFLSKIVASANWNKLKPYVLTGIGILCLAIVYFRIMGNSSLEFVSAWNLTQLCVLILAFLLIRTVQKGSLSHILKPLPLLAILGLTVSGLSEIYINRINRTSTDQFTAIGQLKDQQDPKTIYVIPTDWTSFRMNAHKSVFADQNLVYGPALPDLTKRLRKTESAFESGDFSGVVGLVPDGVRIKLIIKHDHEPNGFISKEPLTENYSCYVLKE